MATTTSTATANCITCNRERKEWQLTNKKCGWCLQNEREENGEKIKEATRQIFKELRKSGFIARMGFACCGSCASYEIGSDIKEMTEEKRAKLTGVAYYHKQTADRLKKDGTLNVYYFSPKDNATREEETKVGQIIADAYRAKGFTVIWDGSPDTSIEVTA